MAQSFTSFTAGVLTFRFVTAMVTSLALTSVVAGPMAYQAIDYQRTAERLEREASQEEPTADPLTRPAPTTTIAKRAVPVKPTVAPEGPITPTTEIPVITVVIPEEPAATTAIAPPKKDVVVATPSAPVEPPAAPTTTAPPPLAVVPAEPEPDFELRIPCENAARELDQPTGTDCEKGFEVPDQQPDPAASSLPQGVTSAPSTVPGAESSAGADDAVDESASDVLEEIIREVNSGFGSSRSPFGRPEPTAAGGELWLLIGL